MLSKHKKTIHFLQFNRVVVTAGLLAFAYILVGTPANVSADPAVTTITCNDKKEVQATKGMAKPNDKMNSKDYDVACKKHKGYTAPKIDVNLVANKITADNVDTFTDDEIKKQCDSAYNKRADIDGCITKAKQARGSLQKKDSEGTEYTGSGNCAGVDTAIIKCSEKGGEGTALDQNGVWVLLLLLIKIMTAGVGLLAVGGLAYGALLWTTAGGSAAQITKSKEIIFNVVIGIVAFALMYAFLQYLIPGGVFN